MRLLILDRDGVLNRAPEGESRYILSLDELVVNLDILELVSEYQKLGGTAVVATNQQCLGKGLISIHQLEKIHKHINDVLTQCGGNPMKFFICPHLIAESCTCRKPAPGLLIRAAKDFNVHLNDCIFIGDQITDAQAATKVNCSYIDIKAINFDLEHQSSSNIALSLWEMERSER
jgi:D-glycero-D-manno-heptose 1,7-bisphosphate phosphatase